MSSVENEVKPESLKMDKFVIQAEEYLSKLEEYKKFDKMMKQYESNIKNYMVENDIDIYKNEKGRITIDYIKVNCLNRALIEDIHQYYEETTRVVMRKTLKTKSEKKLNKVQEDEIVDKEREKRINETMKTAQDAFDTISSLKSLLLQQTKQ
jgi:hypothetical protein